jgi:hypothetical protein
MLDLHATMHALQLTHNHIMKMIVSSVFHFISMTRALHIGERQAIIGPIVRGSTLALLARSFRPLLLPVTERSLNHTRRGPSRNRLARCLILPQGFDPPSPFPWDAFFRCLGWICTWEMGALCPGQVAYWCMKMKDPSPVFECTILLASSC